MLRINGTRPGPTPGYPGPHPTQRSTRLLATRKHRFRTSALPGGRCDLRWDRAGHARCPERSTEDVRLHFWVLIGTIQGHKCRNDDPRLVFREFPILGAESTLAARAALASRAQGLHELSHSALLEADGPFDLDHILAVARLVGLDAERLVHDMEDPSLDALIERNAVLANALSVRGTPVLVIGDRMIRSALPLEQFRAAIADARVAPEGARNKGAGRRTE